MKKVDDHPRESRRYFLSRRVGSVWQLGGLRRFEFTEGRAKGVEAVELRTLAGLQFTVLLDRGMDVHLAQYKGVPLSWLSPTGVVGPSYFEPEKVGFLRSCQGGLFFTCGLTYVGAPCVDGGESLGLHGRVSHLAADDVRCEEGWEGDSYPIKVSGTMREVQIYGDYLTLSRCISTELESREISIHDRVRNEGTRTSPHMYLYHCNLGYPLLDVPSRLVTPSVEVREPTGEKVDRTIYTRITDPTPNQPEQVFYHKTIADEEGFVRLALLNPTLGLGLRLSYRQAELPFLIQWISMAEQVYALGLEPANCTVMGRSHDRAAGHLHFLEPGEVRDYEFSLTVLEGASELASEEKRIAGMVEGT